MAGGLILLPMVLAILYLVQTRRVATFEIVSESMAPALNVGDKWLMEPPTRALRVGDMVVFHPVGEPGRMVVKRIIAQEADRVEIVSGILYVNGAPASPPQGQEVPSEGGAMRQWTVGPGELFVAGDNRTNSTDSREYGPIPADNVVGVLARQIGE
jgi:signal peptidase I